MVDQARLRGLRVHRAIPASRMLALQGVGHDLPPEAAEEVLSALIRLARSRDSGW